MTSHVLHPFERYDQSTIVTGRSQFLVRLSYQGAYFNGVPPQPGLPSVTNALQEQITYSLGQPLKALTFTARTDKGVNANVNYATGWIKNGPKILPQGLTLSPQNPGLGPIDIFPVPEHTFARTLGKSKTYSYRFRDEFLATQKQAIDYWDILPKLDISAMQEAASCIVGTHHFDSFQVRSGKEERNTECTIFSATLEPVAKETHHELVLHIKGNRFLRRMVRTLAGTLAEIGCGLIPAQDMVSLLAKNQSAWVGPTAPARGLTLQDIELDGTLQNLIN